MDFTIDFMCLPLSSSVGTGFAPKGVLKAEGVLEALSFEPEHNQRSHIMGEAAEVMEVEEVELELSEDVAFLATGATDECWKCGSD